MIESRLTIHILRHYLCLLNASCKREFSTKNKRTFDRDLAHVTGSTKIERWQKQ